jgi:hypothetical protein
MVILQGILRQLRAVGREHDRAGRVARPPCKTLKPAVTRAVECTGGVPLDLERGRVLNDAARRDGSMGAGRLT